MAEGINSGYTPATISKCKEKFSIPIYQRLFAWGEDDIQQLLEDLWASYKTDINKKYYIGILTAVKTSADNSKIYLVDGQQRFTVMTLIAIVLSKMTKDTNDDIWGKFLKVGDKENRLSFYARKNDENYIDALIKSESLENLTPTEGGYENYSMKKGIECIEKFINLHGEDVEGFSKYIYKNLTFFISYLPEQYNNNEVLLNKYFESMNSKGKPLENYDILKVELLKKLETQKEKSECTLIWNNVYSDFQKEKSENNNSAKENSSDYSGDNSKTNISIIELLTDGSTNKGQLDKVNLYETKSLFSFPLFLLLVRYKQIQDKNKNDSKQMPEPTVFFNTNNLLKSFKDLLDNETDKIPEFFMLLEKYNEYLNDYFINKGNGNGFEFSTTDKLDTDKENSSINDSPSSRKKLEKFQSMLYVSSYNTSYYKWFIPALEYLDNCKKECIKYDKKEYFRISSIDFLNKLKQVDNNEHKEKWSSINTKGNDNDKSYVDLTYQNIDRYWFWRLDYYLWENEKEFFEDSTKFEKNKINIIHKLVVDYKFQRNRSIEHISPQTPQGDASDTGLKKENLHLFGNLAMISSGQNSSLQNASFEEKKGHVKAFINGSKVGSIESLKMLHVYTHYDTWNDGDFTDHQNKMLGLLNRSFGIGPEDNQ